MKCNYEFKVFDGEAEVLHFTIPLGRNDILQFTSCDQNVFDESGKKRIDVPSMTWLTELIVSERFEDPYSKEYVPPKENVEYSLGRDLILLEDFIASRFQEDVAFYENLLNEGSFTRKDYQEYVAFKQVLLAYSSIKDYLKNQKELARALHKKFDDLKVTFKVSVT